METIADDLYNKINKSVDRAILRARKAKKALGKRLSKDQQEAIFDRVVGRHGIEPDFFFFEIVRRNVKR